MFSNKFLVFQFIYYPNKYLQTILEIYIIVSDLVFEVGICLITRLSPGIIRDYLGYKLNRESYGKYTL